MKTLLESIVEDGRIFEIAETAVELGDTAEAVRQHLPHIPELGEFRAIVAHVDVEVEEFHKQNARDEGTS